MLAIPIQKGERVDLVCAFNSFVTAQYGEAGGAKFVEDISKYQQIRDAAISSVDPSDCSVDALRRLNYQMGCIVPRLAGYENELRLSFGWLDGFRPSRKVLSSSLHVDWACTLWNIGAIESSRGATIDRSTDEGIKSANKHFQQAAGIFEHIQKHFSGHLSGSAVSGITTDGLEFAIQLMLAQAQLCFYEKVNMDLAS